MISKKDLDRGYSDTGVIPEEYDNVNNPESVQYKAEEKKWRKEMGMESPFGDEGFLDRDCNGYARY